MPRKTFFLLPLILCFFGESSPLRGQDFLWTHLPGFKAIDELEDVGDALVLLSEEGLFIAPDKSDIGVIYPIGRSEGLSGGKVAHVAYSPLAGKLLVYYKSGAFDIVGEGKTITNSAIAENISISDPFLHGIVVFETKAYLAGKFGLSRVECSTGQIEATYFIRESIKDVARIGNVLYVLGEDGSLRMGDERENLQDPSFWHEIPLPELGIKSVEEIAELGGLLLLQEASGGRLLSYNGETKDIITLFPEIDRLFAITGGAILVKWQNSLWLLRDDATRIQIPFDASSVQAVGTTGSEESIFLAQRDEIVFIKNVTDVKVNRVIFEGPLNNLFFNATVSQGVYYSVGGGRSSDRSWIPGKIDIQNKEGSWTHVTEAQLPDPLGEHFYDPVSIAVDPLEPGHYFVGSWGEGLYEFREDSVFVERYSIHNSPLESALPNEKEAEYYVRVSSLVFDNIGNLWMMQGSTKANMLMRDRQGKWMVFEFPEIYDVNAFDEILILPSGTKWVNMAHRGVSGIHELFVFNDSNTPFDKSDDKHMVITQFPDRTGKSIEAGRYYALALDKRGSLWIGSNKGPLVISNPEVPIREDKIPIATRPVGGKEPNLYYVLDNVPITAIAIDGINNKWLGTSTDGLFLLSEDGSEILAHFTDANSPLISNNIISLQLDEASGLLYIATELGLVTYQTGSKSFEEGGEKAIHVYPNPLRPEDPDLITFTGLVAGMELKIADPSGGLVHEAVASGASYSFNARSISGDRLSPGVYMALFSDPKSKHSYSIRFAIIQ